MVNEMTATRIAELKAIIAEPIGIARKPKGMGRMDVPVSLEGAHVIRQRKIRRHRAKMELARITRNA
jgi:hypothetical protein